MMEIEIEDICDRAMLKWGAKLQLYKAVEECLELEFEIQYSGNGSRIGNEDVKKNLAGEMADVTILLKYQLLNYLKENDKKFAETYSNTKQEDWTYEKMSDDSLFWNMLETLCHDICLPLVRCGNGKDYDDFFGYRFAAIEEYIKILVTSSNMQALFDEQIEFKMKRVQGWLNEKS